MNFNDLLESLSAKVDNLAQTPVVNFTTTQCMPAEMLDKVQPTVWTSRRLNGGDYFAFFNGHFLNVSSLKKELDNLYAQNGYLGKGFDKLNERELLTYATTKQLFKKLFGSAFTVELNPKEVAVYCFNSENFNFTRE